MNLTPGHIIADGNAGIDNDPAVSGVGAGIDNIATGEEGVGDAWYQSLRGFSAW